MIQWKYQHQQKQLWQHRGLMFPGNEPSRALSSQTGVFHGITFAKVKLQEGGGAQSPTSIPPHPSILSQRAPKLPGLVLPPGSNPQAMSSACHFHPGVTRGVTEGPTTVPPHHKDQSRAHSG